MHTMFIAIINELNCLGEVISPRKQVQKILNILPKIWEIKVNVITETKYLKTLTMVELIGNLQTHVSEVVKQRRTKIQL